LPVAIESRSDKNATRFSINRDPDEIITADGSTGCFREIITIYRGYTGAILQQIPGRTSLPAKMTGKIDMCSCMCRKCDDTIIGVISPVNRFNEINGDFR